MPSDPSGGVNPLFKKILDPRPWKGLSVRKNGSEINFFPTFFQAVWSLTVSFKTFLHVILTKVYKYLNTQNFSPHLTSLDFWVRKGKDGGLISLTCSLWLNCAGRRWTWSSRRHIEGAFGSRHTTTNHGSQLRSRCWFYVGRKTGEPRRKTLEAGERPTTTTPLPSFLRNNTGLGGHPSSYNSRPTGLNLKFSGERQLANRTYHPCSPGFEILLKGNTSQNISTVHIKDCADLSLFPNFQRPNQVS